MSRSLFKSAVIASDLKMGDFKIEDLDLYGILGIEWTCDVSEVKKAYRKKALQCHPDKNPDDPNAAKEFHQLTKILEVLTDEAARKAYDKVLSAKKQAEIRNRELGSKRRKLKEALDSRERGVGKSADQLFREEIERLRKEGSRQVSNLTIFCVAIVCFFGSPVP